jgi:hypothetical protein
MIRLEGYLKPLSPTHRVLFVVSLCITFFIATIGTTSWFVPNVHDTIVVIIESLEYKINFGVRE